MITKDPGENKAKIKKRKVRNRYNDLWFVLVIFVLMGISQVMFNTVNFFKSGWGIFGFANNTLIVYKINDRNTMIKPSHRQKYVEGLIGDHQNNGFSIKNITDYQVIFEKKGITQTYDLDSRKFIKWEYIMVKETSVSDDYNQ